MKRNGIMQHSYPFMDKFIIDNNRKKYNRYLKNKNKESKICNMCLIFYKRKIEVLGILSYNFGNICKNKKKK